MRKHKRISAILLALTLIAGTFGTLSPAYATTTKEANYTAEADCLHRVGLFNGTDSGYELDRQPTRAEAAVMLVRVLGLEAEAKETICSHPFTDVPSWADPYVGMLYSKGMAKGVSDTSFGAGSYANTKTYATFILRSLGYKDSVEKPTETPDFSYDSSVQKLVDLGVLTGMDRTVYTESFARNDMVLISYRALFAKLNGKKQTLQESVFAAKGMTSMLDPKYKEAIVTPSWVGDKEIMAVVASKSEGTIHVLARGILRDEANLNQIMFTNSSGRYLVPSGTYKLNTTAANKERTAYDPSILQKGEYVIVKAEYKKEWVSVPYNEIIFKIKDADQFTLNIMGLWDGKTSLTTGNGFMQGTGSGQANVGVAQ